MRIAMLGHKRIPSREGGVEIVVEQLAVRMAAMGHQVTVYNRKGHHVSTGVERKTGADKKKHSYRGVTVCPVFTFEKKSLNAIVYAFLATFKAVAGKFDVIHFHAEGPCAMLWLPHLLGIPTVATIHGLDWQRAKWGGFATRFLLFGEKMAAKFADQVIVLSENVQHYFQDTYGRDTVYIPNGIDRPVKKGADLIQKQYGLTENSYLLFLSRLVPEKGAHYLVDAYRELKKQGALQGKKLVIAGGSSHSGEYVQELKRQVGEDPDILMTGFVEGTALEELYSNAWIYVQPSDVEGMPLSLLEAMSYGNCCVVSDIPENGNVVGEHGLTFQKGQVQDLKQVLLKLSGEPEAVQELKNGAADYICEKFQWQQVVEQTLELYQKAVTAHRKKSTDNHK